MKLISIRHNGYALLFAASICLTVWLGATFMAEGGYELYDREIYGYIYK